MANIFTVICDKIQSYYNKYKTYHRYGDSTYYHLNNNRNIIVNGRYSYGVPTVHIYDCNCKIYIGNYCSIAKGCEILLGGNHHTKWISTYAFYRDKNTFSNWANLHEDQAAYHGNINIGNDVWIGQNVLILPGTNIGNGAVIGAGSVVAGKIPAYSIAVGNPCRVIKMRFSDNQIQALERIAWWNWPYDKINQNLHLLCSGKIDEFINKFDCQSDKDI